MPGRRGYGPVATLALLDAGPLLVGHVSPGTRVQAGEGSRPARVRDMSGVVAGVAGAAVVRPGAASYAVGSAGLSDLALRVHVAPVPRAVPGGASGTDAQHPLALAAVPAQVLGP